MSKHQQQAQDREELKQQTEEGLRIKGADTSGATDAPETTAVPPPPSPFQGQEPTPAQPNLVPLEQEAKDLLVLSRKEPERRNRLGAIFSEIRRTKRAQGVANAGWRVYVEVTFDISYKTAERLIKAFDDGHDCQFIPLDAAGSVVSEQIDQLREKIQKLDLLAGDMDKEPPETPEERAELEAERAKIKAEKAEMEAQKATLEAQLQADKAAKDAGLLAKTPEIGAKFWTVGDDFQLKEASVVERGPGWVRFESGGTIVHLDRKGQLKGYFAGKLDAAKYRFESLGTRCKKQREDIQKVEAELAKMKTKMAELDAIEERLLALSAA